MARYGVCKGLTDQHKDAHINQFAVRHAEKKERISLQNPIHDKWIFNTQVVISNGVHMTALTIDVERGSFTVTFIIDGCVVCI